jgi:hypothetical protein
MSKTKLMLDVVQDMRALADSLKAMCDAIMANEPETKTETTAPKTKPKAKEPQLSLEDVRSVLAKKSQAGKTAEVRGLIEKYGANKLSEVDAKHYVDLLKDAEEL